MKIRKAMALLMALVMTLSLSISVAAYEVPEANVKALTDVTEDLTGKVVILHSNDVHGAIAGYAYMAALKTAYEAKGAEVILVDAGDFSQGDPNVSVSKGATAVEMMNAAGYDIVALGNHEFDYGYEQLMNNLSKATFKTLCADVLKDGKPILDPNTVVETKAGVKIGFFGLETPETQTKVNPGLIQGITFLSNSAGKTELNDCAKQQIADLKAKGADLVIGLFHLGVDDESAADGHRSADVYAAAEGIDFVIDGHSHTVMTAGENNEPIQSTGTKFANVGVVVIDGKKIADNYLVSTEGLEGNAEVAAAAQKIADEVAARFGAVFAKSEVELNGKKAPNGNRDSQTNNGNLITDAMKWNVLKEEGAVTVDADHVVVITNGGGIRAAIQPGDVTMKDINTVLPFGNTIAVVYVTGAELIEALEASTCSLPIGGYPQTEGITWTLDTTKAYDKNAETYPESTYYGPASIKRVTIKDINGQPFDETATYAVITNNFCAAGGDTYYIFKNASAQFDTGIPLDEAVMAYIEEELGGVISAEKYAAARGDQRTWAPTTVKINEYAVELDGEKVTLNTVAVIDANGFETNYVRVRDLAALLNGTAAQYAVDWDAENNAVVMNTKSAYTAIGGEGTAVFSGTHDYDYSPAKTMVDGEAAEIIAVLLNDANGGGYTYYQLRDLGKTLGFNVGWTAERGIFVETANAYTDAN